MGFAIRVDDRERCPSGKLPLLPLRDVVVFPHMTLPLFVGRPGSVAAIEGSRESERLLFATAQRRPEVSEPEAKDLHSVGTLARVLQVFRLPDGTMRILVEGVCRARLVAFYPCEVGSEVEIEPIPELVRQPRNAARGLQALQTTFAEFHGLSRRVPEDLYASVLGSRDPVQAAYLIAGQVLHQVNPRQDVLEATDAESRLAILGRYLDAEVASLRAAPRLVTPEPRVESKSRRPAAEEGDGSAEIEELESAIRSARMPAPVRTKAMQELDRLARMPAFSPEATVTRGYLHWLTSVPWHRRTRDRRDLRAAEQILDAGHHGLRKVKDRILEHLAVVQLTRRHHGPVLCLVGPPGVGKTSLGEAVADALGRNFARISLGGLRDEAEIRGHRRTYIGAMPGRIVQAIRRAGTVNPVLLLDEVDKLGADYRGDPAAALLEVLDPEQNHTFSDHYLEVDYDLSQVLFLTTANRLEDIPPALLDRMELLRLSGYLETEKLEIARRHLLPKQFEAAGLTPEEVTVMPETLHRLVRGYTREAGVRGLEREIASILRKAARAKASGTLAPGYTVDLTELERLLGPARHGESTPPVRQRIGVANGVAWSEAGGELLSIEVSTLPGTGQLILTGRLGETMRESAQTAISYVRSRAHDLGLEPSFHRELDLHIHVPEGEVPKNGPSAGVTIALALVSALTGRPTHERVAASGEITLHGRVLPVGGLAEKAIAAHRSGMRTLLLPESNQRHLGEIPDDVRAALEIVLVSTMDEVLQLGLAKGPRRRGTSKGKKSSERYYAA